MEKIHPPPPAYIPQPHYIVPPVISIANPRTSSYPIPVKCPHCQKNVITCTEPESGLLTWLLCGSSAVLGFVAGCCLIPFCVDACKDINHFCPECKMLIAKNARISKNAMEKVSPYPTTEAPPYTAIGHAPVFVATATPRNSSYPIPAKCPNCHKDVLTRTEPQTGLLTWLLCGGSFVFGLVAGCCLIPFFVDACKDINHFCPECQFLIGKYERIR